MNLLVNTFVILGISVIVALFIIALSANKVPKQYKQKRTFYNKQNKINGAI